MLFAENLDIRLQLFSDLADTTARGQVAGRAYEIHNHFSGTPFTYRFI
jgi:hypothetical protein